MVHHNIRGTWWQGPRGRPDGDQQGSRRTISSTNLDSKSRCPVIDVLMDKHPDCRVPSDEDFDAYPDAANLLDTMPVYWYKECIAEAAAHLSGSAGPCGIEAEMLKHWLLRYGVHSEHLREAMADWVDWLSNGLPPYAAYCAVNMVQTIALDKSPGIWLLGVGEVWMRLWSDCSHMKTRAGATNACGNTQLCTGLQSGIEANLHVVQAIWPQSAGWTKDIAAEEEDDGDPPSNATLRNRVRAEGVLAPRIDPGAAEDSSFSRYKPGTGFNSALFDARNGFNEINRYLMLWYVAHRWNRGSRFAFNRYRHWVRCLVWSEPGEPALVIHSRRGPRRETALRWAFTVLLWCPLYPRCMRQSPRPYSHGTATMQAWLARQRQMLGASTSSWSSAHHTATFLSLASLITFARQRMNLLPARLLRALASRSTTQEGSGT